MRLYRARGWRGGGAATFDPLDSRGSISGPLGWRFNDPKTEILYTAEVEALATLEVAARPGWEGVRQVLIATIEIPDGAIANPADLGLTLPTNWNARPVAPDSRTLAREFLNAIARLPAGRPRPIGLRVPSVVSATDSNVLIDPARKSECVARLSHRIPFMTLLATRS